MSFTTPIALILLLLVPYFLWLGRPRASFGRQRSITTLVLRTLIIVSLILSIAGLQIVRASDQLAVVFLIDKSDSMPEQTVEASRQFAQDAIDRMRPNDQAAIVVFGSDALVERPMTSSREVGPIESTPLPLNTDMAEAIRLGMALYPPGAARRLVILSDGLANSGDAEEAARLAAASGVEIVSVPFAALTGQEILVTDVGVPTRLNEGQIFDLSVAVESTVTTPAVLRVLAAGEVLVQENVELVEGINRYSFTLQASEVGLNAFRVQVVPESEDIFYQNNELSAFSQVVGPPRVLIVADDEAESANLAQALLQQGLSVDTVTSSGLSADISVLSAYQSVVLANIPAQNLGPRKMEAVQLYVRDLGGGLVVVGGPNAYGTGGYFMTPLEETLPVDMQLKDQERLPQLTVMYVIDKSGSMADTSLGGFPKMELAKEAILRSLALLGPTDRIGVIAFDENASIVQPLGPASERVQIAQNVASLRAGGGTDIYAGLLAMSQILPDAPGRLRHVVLLSDGGASPEGISPLVEEMYNEHGITLSVIAIGQGYAPFLEDLPLLADGRFHNAFNVDTIPEIFSEETIIATRAYIIENEFQPALTSSSPILTGISGTPSLFGYVGTTIKPTAQQILITDKEDPLLAAWQYGLGRSVAWTSDATGRWAGNWVNWEEYARFWGQAVRWTITEGVSQNVEVSVIQEGEQVRVVVDAIDDEGLFLNGLDMDANIISPDLDGESIDVQQVAPGRYEGVFTPTDEGAYFVRVAGVDADNEGTPAVAQTAGYVLSYSPEYRSFEGNPDYLRFIAGLTGGDIVTDPTAVFVHNLDFDRARQPLWPFLLLLATTLLPFDIAVRRLVITRSDLVRLRNYLLPGRSQQPDISSRQAQVNSLFQAKQRAEQRTTMRDLPSFGAKGDQARTSPEVAPVAKTPQVKPRTAVPKPAPPKKTSAASGNTASSLLARKRARQEQQGDE